MVDKRLSDSDIKLLLQGFRSKGISEPVIELAKKIWSMDCQRIWWICILFRQSVR